MSDADDIVITDDLSLAFRSLEDGLPENISKNPQATLVVKKLDLTETGMRDLSKLSLFPNLSSLVLDNNALATMKTCPRLLKVHTLWLNNNSFNDLPQLIDELIERFPKVIYLSLMRNPCCPGFMNVSNPDMEAYRLYRLYVIYRMPAIITLDWTDVKDEERREAKLRGQYAIKRKSVARSTSSDQIEPIVILDKQNESKAEIKSIVGRTDQSRSTESKNSEGNRFIIDSHL